MKGSSKTLANSATLWSTCISLALSVLCQRSRFEGLQRTGWSAAPQRLVQTPEAAHLSADLRPRRFQPGHVEAGGVSSPARPHLSLLYQKETDPVGINCVLLFCFLVQSRPHVRRRLHDPPANQRLPHARGHQLHHVWMGGNQKYCLPSPIKP